MPELPSGHRERRLFIAHSLEPLWIGFGLSVVISLAYFLAAQLSLKLLLKPDGVAVFWPAAGISSGILITIGLRAWLPVVAGVVAATIGANLMGDRDVAAAVAFGICNAAEALIVAGLLEYYFPGGFNLDQLRKVLGLIAAAIIATVISGVGGAIAYKLFHSPTVPMITTFRHWFASDVIGIVAVAPLIIGLGAAVRVPPPRSEVLEGALVLVALALMTGLIISLPEQPWETVVPGALLFPMLLWLAARCRPVFAAAGAFMISLTIVWTAIFGVGHFGDAALPIDDRLLQAQAIIMVATSGAFVLAALFAERRDYVAHLTRSNVLLTRERDNKLINLQAVGASIAHEMKQPLTAIAVNSAAALTFVRKYPPDLTEIEETLTDIVNDSHRASETLDGIRALFRTADQGRQRVNVNQIALDVLTSLHRELKDHDVIVIPELASELPVVEVNKSQLQQVLLNLSLNAVEAMSATADRDRVLRVRTGSHNENTVVVTVQDTGPGIATPTIDRIFDGLVTTKARGMGLGLAICRMIVERHGGRLTASSDGKNGALFQFTLPVGSAGT